MTFSLFLVILAPSAVVGVTVPEPFMFHNYGTDKIDVEKVPPSHLRTHVDPGDAAHNTAVSMSEQGKPLPNKWLRLFTLGISSDGESSWKGQGFRLFLESARGSGADIVLLGDKLPHGIVLPKNVVHLQTTWDQIASFIEKTYFNGEEQYNFRHPWSYNKANDVKPLIPLMLPEIIEGYKWWGWCDNDIWLGNLMKILPREMDEEADIWSGNPGTSHGPLTLLRNTPELNSLLLHEHNAEVVKHVMSWDRNIGFDEWGMVGNKTLKADGINFTTSFSGIITTANRNKELKMASHPFGPIMHACKCMSSSTDGRDHKSDCSTLRHMGLDDVCAMTHDVSPTGDVTTTLHRADGGEWLYCHFQCSHNMKYIKVPNPPDVKVLEPPNHLLQTTDEYLGSKVVLFQRRKGVWTQNKLSFPRYAPLPHETTTPEPDLGPTPVKFDQHRAAEVPYG